MSIDMDFILDMDDLFDLPIFLSTLFVFVVGHTANSIITNKRRAELALQQRERYFSRLIRDSNKMGEEVNQRWSALKDKHADMVAQLLELGFTTSEIECPQLSDESELKKVKAHLEDIHRQIEECDREMSKVSKNLGLDEVPSLTDLQKLAKELEDENRELERQLGEDVARSQSTCEIKDQDLDPEVLDFLEKHDYTIDNLNEIYEALLELQARHCNQDLDDYLSSLEQSNYKYASNLTELDVKRKEVELCRRRTRETYNEELNTFNESRIEYLFKITGAEKELAALLERNQILETIAEIRIKGQKNDLSLTS